MDAIASGQGTGAEAGHRIAARGDISLDLETERHARPRCGRHVMDETDRGTGGERGDTQLLRCVCVCVWTLWREVPGRNLGRARDDLRGKSRLDLHRLATTRHT